MTRNMSEARLRFLKAASVQLATVAPNISAELMSAFTQSLSETQDDTQQTKKEWAQMQRECCSACGNLMLPGWSNSLRHGQPGSASARKQPQKRTSSPKVSIVTVCLRCDRKRMQLFERRQPKHMSFKINHNLGRLDVAVPSASHDQEKVTKSANATSKQRKKSRKGGLQAMLEKNKGQSSGGGIGLDLMDFMQ